MSQVTRVECRIGRQTIYIETGELALQTNGSVLVQMGDSVVLVTAVASREVRKGIDFFPLIVDYEEKMYAVGRIPGSFTRREGRPTENAILTSRLIDRSIRPLFPEGYRNDVQIVATTLSSDQVNPADILGIIGASAALSISDIPFEGPIGAVRVGRIDDKWIINPTFIEIEEGTADIVVAGTYDSILMVEAGTKIIEEETILDGIDFAHSEIKKIINTINDLTSKVGKPKKKFDPHKIDEEFKNYIIKEAEEQVISAMNITDNFQREETLRKIEEELINKIEEFPQDHNFRNILIDNPKEIHAVLYELEKKIMRKMILQENRRLDGRSLSDIREISCKVGFLKRAHGSALFTRGATQAMSLLTLGSISDAQPLDGVEPETVKGYIHHYNFPGYSTGEVKSMRFPSRREIGHGALAERAIVPILPPEDKFPYTMRLVSEILSSNGSTSMASTCGSCLALMDGGVPIKEPVAGIAMGLIKEEDNLAILSDILGTEDHLGDMDFKVTGTKNGVTALQMDIKIKGISIDIMRKALEQARLGRLFILEKMLEVIKEPRPDISPYAPRITTMYVNPEKIGEIIGPGGKTIKKIIEETGAKIDIDDDGTIYIVTNDKEAINKVRIWIEELTMDVEIGKIYDGKVTRTTNFGAFVEIFPGHEGMVHISQLSKRRLKRVEDAVRTGDTVKVKVLSIDNQGKVNLTRIETEEEESSYEDSYVSRNDYESRRDFKTIPRSQPTRKKTKYHRDEDWRY